MFNLNPTCFGRILCLLLPIKTKQQKKKAGKILELRAPFNFHFEDHIRLFHPFSLLFFYSILFLPPLLPRDNKNLLQFKMFEWTKDQTVSPPPPKNPVKKTSTRCKHPSFTGAPTPLNGGVYFTLRTQA